MLARLAFLMITSLSIISCALVPGQASLYSGNLAAGTLLELREPLPFRADRSRIFLQEGEVVKHGRLNRFVPHCNFESTKLAKQGDVIEPDRFRIVRVTEGLDHVVMFQGALLASGAEGREMDRPRPIIPECEVRRGGM